MNENSKDLANTASDQDHPPSLFDRLKSSLNEYWHGPADVAALREAAMDLIEQAQAEDGSPSVEREFLSNILSLREKEVADCMVPRAEIVSTDVDGSMNELIELMLEHGHSRIPVYRETLDDTIGVLHIKDLVPFMAQGKECVLADVLRPVLFVAPSMPVSKLLLQMRQARQHMAMVIDEFGGVDGLVTIEDLVEEIVGDIHDEYDAAEAPYVTVRPDGSLIIDARMEIEDFEKRFGPLVGGNQRESIDTLAGFVFHLAGHVPKVGETIEGPSGILFDILQTDQNRIGRVRVRGIKQVQGE